MQREEKCATVPSMSRVYASVAAYCSAVSTRETSTGRADSAPQAQAIGPPIWRACCLASEAAWYGIRPLHGVAELAVELRKRALRLWADDHSSLILTRQSQARFQLDSNPGRYAPSIWASVTMSPREWVAAREAAQLREHLVAVDAVIPRSRHGTQRNERASSSDGQAGAIRSMRQSSVRVLTRCVWSDSMSCRTDCCEERGLAELLSRGIWFASGAGRGDGNCRGMGWNKKLGEDAVDARHGFDIKREREERERERERRASKKRIGTK